MKIKNCIVFLIILLFFLYVYSARSKSPEPDNASLSGYVTDVSTGETLIGATVVVEGTKLGALTNKSGFFSIQGIPPGRQVISASFIGYDKARDTIIFADGRSEKRNFKLQSSSVMSGEVSVEAQRDVDKREINISKINIPVQQIKKIRVGGETDVFRSLQYLPGILTSSQLSSGLFVRGGSPDQNLVLLDGATVYNPTHLFGFISTFNTDAIKDVELIKGGFPAEFGSRLSAVLNLTQKDGNREEFEGLASVGVLSSRISAEGPLFNGSWYFAARRTYLDLLLELVPEDPDAPYPDFKFYDVNFKVSQNIGDDDKISFSGFTSSDVLDYNSNGISLGLDLSNYLGSLRWSHVFGDNLFTNVLISGSKYINDISGDQAGYPFSIENSIRDLTLKTSAEYFASEALTLKFGADISQYNFFYFQNLTGDEDSTAQSGSQSIGSTNRDVVDWNYGLYLQGNYMITDLLSMQAGLRANYWDHSNNLTYDPRIALRYQLQENIALKAAYGWFHQNLKLVTFGDLSIVDIWLPTDSTIPPSKAEHYIFTVETQPYENYDLSFDVYYKKLSNITEMNRFFLDPKNVSDLFFIGKGNAYGAEVFVQKRAGRLTGWLGYAIGYISNTFDSINAGQSFRPKYDRTHDFKLVLQYSLNDHWELGGSFIFQSGQSYTGATSRILSTLYRGETSFGRGKIFTSQLYGLRLPPSHQLNINASYLFKIYDLDSRFTLDIFNVYNRRDIWFRYYNTRNSMTTVEDVRLLPILPTISFEIKL